jgi:hypothetical protein
MTQLFYCKNMSFNFAPPGFIQKWLKEADDSIRTDGLHKTMRLFTPRLNLFPKLVFENKKTFETLEKSPTLVVANHPNDSEPLSLYAALPPRTDSYLIANAEILGILPSAKKYLLPVYIKHRIQKEKRTWHPLVQFVDRCYPQTHFPFHKAHQKNIEAIKMAAEKINDDHQSVIFPENSLGTWQAGVGHIISQLDYKNHPQLIMAYVTGTTRIDLFRSFPLLRLLFPKIKIHFSRPYPLSEFKNKEPKIITSLLEKKYKSWIQGV